MRTVIFLALVCLCLVGVNAVGTAADVDASRAQSDDAITFAVHDGGGASSHGTVVAQRRPRREEIDEDEDDTDEDDPPPARRRRSTRRSAEPRDGGRRAARFCITNFGTCPLGVAMAVDDPCVCYTTQGQFPGIAR